MTESTPASILDGLTLEVVEWLPSGAEGGLVRVRGRWGVGVAPLAELPILCVSVGGGEASRFESLPDAPSARLGNGSVWRGAYLVPESLVRDGALWLEWPGGERSAMPAPAGLDARAAPAVVEPVVEEEPGGELIDRAVLAERRARRAEAAEQAQARVASEALRALDAVELRGAELEERVETLTAERDELAGRVSALEQRSPHDEHARAALGVALAAAAAARRQAGDLQTRMRAAEVARSGDAVRLRVLEAREAGSLALRSERAEQEAELSALRQRATELDAEAGRAREQAIAAAADLDETRRDFSRRLAESGEAAQGAAAELETTRAALADRESELATARSELEGVRAELAELGKELSDAHAATSELGAALEAERAARATAGAEAETARSEAASATASLQAERVARASLEGELERERAARSALSDALDAETAALASLHTELNAERAVAADLRAEAGRAPDLQAELEAERVLAGDLRTELEAQRTSAAELEDELGRERAARQADQSALAALRDDLAAERAALAEVREQLESLRTEVESERQASRDELAAELRTEMESAREADRAVVAVLRADLDAERAAREADQAELAALRTRLAEAESEGGLLDRVAELDRRAAGLADELELQRRAREQAEAAAGAVRSPDEESSRVVADLDAAASALRERPPNGTTVEAAPPVEIDEAMPAEVEAPPAEAPDEELAPAAAPPEKRPIVSAPAGPSRAHATGRSQRQYPWLRGALVKLAHDDPAAAGRLIAGLLPVQSAIVQGPVDYDLTIAEVGTFAVTVAGGRAYVKDVETPRGRRETEFHLSADALTLAELIAGVPHKIGRFRGAARVSGRKRRLKPLRAIPGATLSLAEAARAGARLEPALVFRTFPYVIHAAWSRDHSFTVAQQVAGDPPGTWYVNVGNGGGVRVSTTPPEDGPDATVTMTPEGYGYLLRGEPAPPGHRPIVRGDRAAVAALKSWIDRAQAG